MKIKKKKQYCGIGNRRQRHIGPPMMQKLPKLQGHLIKWTSNLKTPNFGQTKPKVSQISNIKFQKNFN